MHIKETIYKRTKSGKIQIWLAHVDSENGRYRTVSGQIDGAHTTSEWTVCEPKNIGKSNETTVSQQAFLEVEAMYRKRLEREYHKSIDEIDHKRYTKPEKALKWYEDSKKRPTKGSLIGVQPKLDGMRCLASSVGCRSQDGKIIPGAPHITEALKDFHEKYPEFELDGELYNHEFKEDFEGLMSSLKKEPKTPELAQRARNVVQYHVYDIVCSRPYWEKSNESDDPFSVGRYQILENIFDIFFEKYGQMFQLVPMVVTHMDDTGKVVEDIDDDYIEQGYEGSIVRVLSDRSGYEAGARRKMFKVKNFIDDEFPIVEVLEGKGNWSGHAKAIRVQLPNGNICKASVKGDKEYARDLLLKKNEIVGKLATVKYLRYSKKGMLNLPIFKSIRWDA
jgi:ATP-dependent DNA ligase